MAAAAAVSPAVIARRPEGLAVLLAALVALVALGATAAPAATAATAAAADSAGHAAADPAAEGSDWCSAPRVLRETARDDFGPGFVHDSAQHRTPGGEPGAAHNGRRWRLEAEQAGTQVLPGEAGGLDIRTPAGLSLWWHAELQGDYELRFEARALPAPDNAGALAGRVSDLNLFWNATEADGRQPQPRDGAFASYHGLRAYYVGYGANGNRTTRLRAYGGQGQRQVLDGWADAPEAGPDDRRGAMSAATRLQAGRWLGLRVISHAPRAGSAEHGQLRVDDRRLFTLAQPQPLLRGWFALRTTASRLQLRGFRIFHCTLP
ncbi:DUF6250 domain-containing protein [Aquabacterium sp. OR-4]|uniref:DUF6250 domain-containing protein n=1 Tax=Aquabacterium sp. OR-4 TaxID=2978127 RepID=UPI0028C77041|nr:DUF6250 domain-containing protein [Aquabacterium sp. OR-4]MDT7838891.1 DUF6250 domain-containing protein [Aquabacterium sp. OR-4]